MPVKLVNECVNVFHENKMLSSSSDGLELNREKRRDKYLECLSARQGLWYIQSTHLAAVIHLLEKGGNNQKRLCMPRNPRKLQIYLPIGRQNILIQAF
jgi:hypothetical protein